jgi:GT2 family glycosyltransferase
MSMHETRLTAVMITYNRQGEMLRSLEKLCSLPEAVPIILVDNGSSDGSAEAVARRWPQIQVIRSPTNIGAAARNLGVEQAKTPYVALCDDDTWWAPGCLSKAADLLDVYPHVALLTARLLNGPEAIEDPICRVMASSPLRRDETLPGKPVLGFLAGASVVRRSAFLNAGGFDPRLFIGGEEELLTLNLAARGWKLCYTPELIVHHHPSPRRDAPRRSVHVFRNRLWTSWLRRPLRTTWSQTLAAMKDVPRDAIAARGFFGAICGLPWICRERRVVPPELEAQLCLLENENLPACEEDGSLPCDVASCAVPQ